ncbi:MAG: L-2-amino-thiazoline-4-carboxylic acid hydrolase [Blastocatellia bacterium]
MNRAQNEQFVRHTFFNQAQMRLARLASRFTDDPQTVVDEAAAIFDAMLPEMAYVDKPAHPLASALFVCNVNLSLYLALKRRGTDVHDFSRALLNGVARAPIPPLPEESEDALQARLAQFIQAAEASQTKAEPGEDVFEIVEVTNADFDWGYNVRSCALCQSAAKHDAMEVVPYMCAVDDVMSDKNNQGLRRTGSLATGATHCDFRFKRGGQPLRLAEQYPELIQIGGTGATALPEG